jgi:hypothetical protein
VTLAAAVDDAPPENVVAALAGDDERAIRYSSKQKTHVTVSGLENVIAGESYVPSCERQSRGLTAWLWLGLQAYW